MLIPEEAETFQWLHADLQPAGQVLSQPTKGLDALPTMCTTVSSGLVRQPWKVLRRLLTKY